MPGLIPAVEIGFDPGLGRRIRVLALLIALALGGPPIDDPCGDARAPAEARAQAGVAAAKAGRAAEAVAQFEAAYAQCKSPEYLRSLGRALEAAGRVERALEIYDAFLIVARADDPSRAQIAERREALQRAEIRRRAEAGDQPDDWAAWAAIAPAEDQPTIAIRWADALRRRGDAARQRGDRAAAATDFAAAAARDPRPVDAWWRAVLLETDGALADARAAYAAFAETHPDHPRAADARAAAARLAPTTVVVAPPDDGADGLTLGLAGAGLAGLVFGGISTALAHDARDEADALLARARREGAATAVRLGDVAAQDDRAAGWQVASVVGYGVGAALLLTAGWLAFSDGDAPGAQVQVVPGGVGVAWRFD